jgi:plasmid maintenance system antidote protein VapI
MPVTADTALRLGKFFKTGATFWMSIQTRYDLERAEEVLASEIKKIAAHGRREAVLWLKCTVTVITWQERQCWVAAGWH